MTAQQLDGMQPASAPDMTDSARVRVWDPLVRVFHWSLAAGFATAYIVEDHVLDVHVAAGYLVLGLVIARLIWGVIGTRHARFSDFVRGPRETLRYLRSMLSFDAPRYLGHNPAGAAMIVMLLITLSLTGLSGLALYGAEEFSGPLAGLMSGVSHEVAEGIEEVHEFLANLTLTLVLLHLAGVLISSLAHRENLMAAMISGDKRRGDAE